MLRLEQGDDGFTIYLDSRILAIHNADEPLLKVGIGKELESSLYPDKDSEHAERFALVYYRLLLANEDSLAWAISLSNDPSFQEEVRLLYDGKSDLIHLESTFPTAHFNRYWIRFYSQEDERFYGGGQHSYQFNLKGYTHALYLNDEFFVKQERTLPIRMVRMPSFVSSFGYALIIQGAERMTMNALYDHYLELEIWGKPSGFLWISGESLKDVVACQSDYFGRARLMPLWAMSHVIAGFRGPMRRIQQGLTQLRNMGLGVQSLWLQDWAHATFPTFGLPFDWNWICAHTLRDSFMSKVRDLNERSISVAAYMNSFLAEGSALFNEADSHDFLVSNKSLETYLYPYQEFSLAIVDLTNKEAFRWFVQVIRTQLVELGIRIWVIDDGSHLPLDSVLSDGTRGQDVHHRWPMLLAKAAKEAISIAGYTQEDILVLGNSAWDKSLSHLHGVILAREYVHVGASWSLKPTCMALLSGSMSGYGVQATVIGHSMGMPAPNELLIRHAELATFTAFFWLQEADARYQGFRYYEDSKTMHTISRLATLFEELATYRNELAQTYVVNGLPMNRPLFLYDEEDPINFSIDDQFMLGDEILVAPILHPGQHRRSLYLPKGTWQHFTSNLRIEGPRSLELSAPLGEPLAFYLVGSSFENLFKRAAYQFCDGKCAEYRLL